MSREQSKLLTAYCSPLTDENTAIQLSNIEAKGAATCRASNIPGVTAPKITGRICSSCFRCFGSGNAAPAVLIWLSGAISAALFGLIIWLFEAEADRAVPGQAEPHT